MSTPPQILTTSTSSSPYQSLNSPGTSSIGLQPNVWSGGEESYLEVETPNVLSDRILGLHTPRPNTLKRDESLLDILSNTRSKSRKARGEEEEPLLVGEERLGGGNGVNDEDEVDEEDEDSAPRVRSDRSRSKSQRRKVPWHKRPSPMWFLPSTLAMSLSIGMIIAPKFEIYTQLICRNIGPERSGTTLPAPSTSILDNDALRGSHSRKSSSTVSISNLIYGNFDETSGRNDEVLDFVDKAVLGSSKEKEDDSWSKQCRRSPAVQASVAELATILTLIMGILSALTAGYWGALSDRRGRKPILALSLFGTIFMDAIFLIVVNYHDVVGYKFLLVGPLLDGLLGGMSTAQAAVNAYLSDCTEAGSRARIFSILGGLLFGGIALGPTLGAISIQLSGSVMFPFYLALALHTLYFLSVLFLFPESLSVSRQLDARSRHTEEIKARSEQEVLEDVEAEKEGGFAVIIVRAKRFVETLFGFARPLALLLPRKREEGGKEEDRPILESRGPVGEGWDYELTKVALAYATYVLVIAIMGPKLMYASYKYGYGPEENGFYLSFLGSCRVFALIIAIPLLIKFCRKPSPLPLRPRPENASFSTTTTFDSTMGTKRLTKGQIEWESDAKYFRVLHDSHFDLFLARISILVDIATYLIIATNGGSQVQFLIGSGLSSLGAGTTAALQSLALALTSPRDSGRLFASLSVLGSISSQVIGPIFFASIYIATVKTFPELMFYCATGIFVVAFSITLSVNLKRKIVDGEALIDGIKLPIAVGVEGNEEEGGRNLRGRSSTRKAATASEAGSSGIVIRD